MNMRLIYLILTVGILSSMSFIIDDFGCDHTGAVTNKIDAQRGRRGIINTLVLPLMRSLRVKRATRIMMAGATLLIKDENVIVYWKSGGKIRAEKDFWMIDVYGVKKGFNSKDSCAWKCGIVGDSTVEFVDKFSDKSPFPAIYLYKKQVPSKSMIAVLYK